MIPQNATTLQREAETQWVNGPNESLRLLVQCQCGFTGRLGELLCDPDDQNPPTNDFWCPRCKSKGWNFL